ncbi:MAG TPA: MogA/MoaB family molybdenum cofactor biosynthesis protein [Fimbriimonadaceae bacterium]|nr:MogA/MoaB family molybdenum cofactor biosynthesis protein [Fimbriimonadaceae bacterium]
MEARLGVLTVSDSRSTGENEDLSGPAVVAALRLLGYEEFETAIVADEIEAIRDAILRLCANCQAVFTTGGTGFTPRDVTPEATLPLLDKRADNLSELIRLRGLEKTPMSHLSRGIAGVRGSTLIVNLPGSPKGAREGIEALGPLLGPILSALGGEGCTAEG